MLQKLVGIILGCLFWGMVGFAVQNGGAATAEAATARTVVDSRGVQVQLPQHLIRVAPMTGSFAQITAMFGATDKIVAAAPRLPAMFWKLYPQIPRNTTDKRGAFSVESLISYGAQVVYGPLSYFFNDDQIHQLEAAGIAVVVIDQFSTVEDLQHSIVLIGEILGGDAPQKAAAFNAYFNRNIDMVHQRLKGHAPTVRVLGLMQNRGNYVALSNHDIEAEYMHIAGGINVTGEYNSNGRGSMNAVNTEQILIWNPEIIITNNNDAKRAILQEPSLAMVDAVRDRKVFAVPTGVYPWSTPSAEGALQPLWLATVFYPQLFRDIDLPKEVCGFYHEFYHYDITVQEAESILEGGRAR